MSTTEKTAAIGKVHQSTKQLRITLTKSPIGYSSRQKGTVRALGLRRMNHTVKQADTPVIRGMIAKVAHLVTVEEVG